MLSSLSSFTLVILSGYLVVNAVPYLRFKSFLADRYRLLFDAAVFGFAAYALFLILPEAYSSWLESRLSFWNRVSGLFGDNEPVDLKAFYLFAHVAVVLVLLRTVRWIAEWLEWEPVLNLLNRSASKVVMRHGSEMLRLLNRAFEEQIPVQITLNDRKVYIGLIASTIRPESVVQDIRIVPYESGYRKHDTLEYTRTTSYLPFVDLFDYYSNAQKETATRSPDSPNLPPWDETPLTDAVFKVAGKGFTVEFTGGEIEQLADIFGVVIRWDRIESMTFWDKKLGAYFSAASPTDTQK